MIEASIKRKKIEDLSIEETIERIDNLVDIRDQLLDMYVSADYNRAIVEAIKEIGEQVFEIMKHLSEAISEFHIDLFLISRFLFITNERIDCVLLDMKTPVIPAEYCCQSSIKKMFNRDEIDELKNIFFRGLNAFNELVFAENHFIFSDGTIFFNGYWEDIKKKLESDIFKIVKEIGDILRHYYLWFGEQYDETAGKIKEYLNKNISDYKPVAIGIKEIGRDKTQYRIFQIKRDVNCEYGANIY